jgi:hypothetical protein
VANWEQHILPGLLEEPGKELAGILGESLPHDAQPQRSYRGPARVIVPTVRSILDAGETLELKVIILAEAPPAEAAFFWRGLSAAASGEEGGEAESGAVGTAEEAPFRKIPLRHVSRGVYEAVLPAADGAIACLEYYIEAIAGDGEAVRFPAAAPLLNQTLVVVPE